ncbi:MAG: FHIPEP family type III secretion protein [Arsenophonus sp.]|nr:FHIPEP family type III secretion protein [Arsenophonus sp.]
MRRSYLEIQAIGLDVSLERVLIQALQSGGGLEPGLAGNIEQQTIEAINNQSLIGAPQVLIVNHSLRPLMSRFLRRSLPQLAVVSCLEISDERKIRLTSFIGQTVN